MILRFSEFISESVHDQVTLKAIFIVGGPASGKTTVAKTMFSGEPVRIVDSDRMVEYLFKKRGVSLKFDKSKTEEYEHQQDVRREAKISTNNQIDRLLNGLLPVVIDGTGKRFDRVKKQKADLEAIGYDCYLVFVNTSLEVAIQRNKDRERSVPEDLVVQNWHQVQGNLDKFAHEFDQRHFFVVSDKTAEASLHKLGRKIITSQLENPIGHRMKEELKKSGGAYLSDLKKPVSFSSE